MKLPSRRRYPDYYREIKNPISLSRIRAKVVREEYGNLSELASDLSLMFENAKSYNRPDSKLFKDAVKLQKLMQTKFQELLADDEVKLTDELFEHYIFIKFYFYFYRVPKGKSNLLQNDPKDDLVLMHLFGNLPRKWTIRFVNVSAFCTVV